VWAKAVGVNAQPLSEKEKSLLIAENDALVALLYGLSREQLRHIFETFHRGWDFVPRLESALAQYDHYKGE
jgi:hypothetical protein